MNMHDKHRTFLTTAQLLIRYGGRSRNWLARIRQRDPRFPKPIKMNERVFLWDEGAAEDYERVLAEENK